MDGIQSVNGNQAESNDIVIAAVPGKVSGAENLYLIYYRIWIYVPSLNRKVSDLLTRAGPTASGAGNISVSYRVPYIFPLALRNHQEFTPVGDIVLLCLLDRVQVWALRNYQMSKISCSLWETSSNRSLDAHYFLSCTNWLPFATMLVMADVAKSLFTLVYHVQNGIW